VFNAQDPAKACDRLRALAADASAASWWCG
jgi:hypothetical protein